MIGGINGGINGGTNDGMNGGGKTIADQLVGMPRSGDPRGASVHWLYEVTRHNDVCRRKARFGRC